MNDMRAILINVIGGATLVFLGYLANRIRERVATRNERRLWEPLLRQPVSVALTTRSGPFSRSTPRLSLTEARALLSIIPVWSQLGVHPILIDPRNSAEILGDRHLFILGGPHANQLTETVMKADRRLPLVVARDPLCLLVGENSFSPKYDSETGTVVRDYGVIISTRNPFDESATHRAFIAFGVHGFGTEAAVKCLASPSDARKLVRASRGNDFIAIIEVDILGKDYRWQVKNIFVLPTPE